MKQAFLTLLFTILPIIANAAEVVEINDIYYKLDMVNYTAEVTQKTKGKYSGDIVIPNSVDYKDQTCAVTTIGYYAFNGCDEMTSITIPPSITSIQNAFWGCTGLTAVYIDDLKAWCNISRPDFYSSPLGYAHHLYLNGEEIVDLVVPDGVTSIGYGAFNDLSSLTSVTIASSVTSIGERAFFDCTSLASVTIPESVTSIGKDAFAWCSSLTSVSIPNSVTSIGQDAFVNCTGLTSITIPDSVTTLDWVFRGCTGLTAITIPSSMTSIGEMAFSGCTGLTSVTIPNSVTSINRKAFANCTGLTAITIPDNVTSIGEEAFSGCTSLNSFSFPNNVSRIGNNAFLGTAWLSDHPEGVVYVGKVAYLYKGSMPPDENIVIEEGTETISESLFAGRSELASVTIPNSVTTIGNHAFSACTGLTSLVIGNGVLSIGNYALGNCTGLTSLDLGNSVTTISDHAFENCAGLTTITIPGSVRTLGGAFDGCKNLSSVYIDDLAAWCAIDFDVVRRYYEGLSWWEDVVESHNPLEYARHLFLNGEEIKEKLIIPEGTIKVSRAAFNGLTELKSITIPNIDYIDGTFFSGNKLESVNVNSRNVGSFGSFKTITDVVLGSQVETVAPNAFSGNPIKTVTLDCISIGDWFDHSDSITDVILGDDVESIKDNAFNGCKNITNLTLGKSIKDIGSRAFGHIDKLMDVYCYAEIVPNTDRTAFENSYIDYVTLHVPQASMEEYKKTAPWKYFKEIVACHETGIINVTTQQGVKAIYTPNGRKLANIQKGVNIIRMRDGKTRKVMSKKP